MCLPACLWAQIARNLISRHDWSSDASFKMRWLSILVIGFSVSSIRIKLSYHKHVHHNPSIIGMYWRCWVERKWLCVLWDEPFPEVQTNQVESMKTWYWKVTPFHSWVSLHHTFVVHNVILSCLTGSYLTTSLKSNYCVRPKVNLNIADSISFYFNFGKTMHLQ